MRSFILEAGTIGNTHFVAIPFNAAHKAGAMVVADFLLSPEAQAQQAGPAGLGRGTVLELVAWRPQIGRCSTPCRIGIATLPPEALLPVRPEPHPSWMVAIEAEWLRRQRSAPALPRQPAALLRHLPALTLLIFLGPVLAGLLGAVLPAFGYLPALGGERLSLEPWRQLRRRRGSRPRCA